MDEHKASALMQSGGGDGGGGGEWSEGMR